MLVKSGSTFSPGNGQRKRQASRELGIRTPETADAKTSGPIPEAPAYASEGSLVTVLTIASATWPSEQVRLVRLRSGKGNGEASRTGLTVGHHSASEKCCTCRKPASFSSSAAHAPSASSTALFVPSSPSRPSRHPAPRPRIRHLAHRPSPSDPHSPSSSRRLRIS